MIVRVQAVEHAHGTINQGLLVSGEAYAALMEHIHIGRQDVEPARLDRALAQIVLLTVATAKFLGVQVANLV